MAQLILKGSMSTIEFTSDPEDGQTIATCIEHSEADGRLAPPGNCDTLDDATEYAADHADRGTR
jgi:hypothetical protein